MINLLEFLKALLSITGNKFAKFFSDVWSGVTGKVMEDCHKITNEVVRNVENIGEIVTKNITVSSISLAEQISSRYGYNIDFDDVNRIKSDKSFGKFLLSKKLIQERMKKERKNYVSHAVNLSIEFAVAKFFH